MGNLKQALEKVKRVIEKKSALPVLSCTHLQNENDKLSIQATDLENYLTVSIKSNDNNSWTAPVNFDKLHKLAQATENITLQRAENKLIIKTEKGQHRLTISEDEFPEFPKPEFSFSLSTVFLHKAIYKVSYAISKDLDRRALQGLYIHEHQGKLHFVGTDGHRLALFWLNDLTDNEVDNLLIPRKTLKVLEALLKDYVGSLKIGKDTTFLHFAGDDFTLSVRQLEGEYPDYMAAIPNEFNIQVCINKNDFLSALKEISAIAENSAFPVRLSLSNNKLLLQVSEPDYGEGEVQIEVEYEGEPISIGFNGRYLTEALERFDTSNIWLKIVDTESAVVISSEDEEIDPYMCLIMPMRL
jgi:DNA polymerase-3 subunit beta